MKNNEHLALFVLGIGTLALTFLLLFALNNRDIGGTSIVEKQVSTTVAQADVVPQPQAQPPQPQVSMDVLDRQITDTFAKAAAYLGRGSYDEKEHIALLERLEFYGGMSSIKPEYKERAQDLIKDMGRLLTLKESVARQVQLAAQINAVETDVQIHLAKGVKDKAASKKLMDRIETLYAIHGLSEGQNRQLRTSLAALKNAYKAPETKTASRTVRSPESSKVDAHEASKPAAPVVKAKVETRPETKAQPKPVTKALVPAAAPQQAKQPVQKVVTATPVSQKVENRNVEIVRDKYYRVMTLISSYFVKKHYNENYHAMLTDNLLELAKNKDVLSKEQQERLSKTIAKMKRIDERFGGGASSR